MARLDIPSIRLPVNKGHNLDCPLISTECALARLGMSGWQTFGVVGVGNMASQRPPHSLGDFMVCFQASWRTVTTQNRVQVVNYAFPNSVSLHAVVCRSQFCEFLIS